MAVPAAVLLVLAMVELIVGMTKSLIAARCGKQWKMVLTSALLIEFLFCVVINVLTIHKSYTTPAERGARESIYLILLIPGVFDVLFFILEAGLCLGLVKTKLQKNKHHNHRSYLYLTMAFLVTGFLVTPLAIYFFHTTSRNVITISGRSEAIAAWLASPLFFFAGIISLVLVGLTEEGFKLNIYFLLFAFSSPLLVCSAFSLYGTISGETPVLLAVLLVVAPPAASFSFTNFKSFLLDAYGEEQTIIDEFELSQKA